MDVAATLSARSLDTFAPLPGVAATVTMPDGEDGNDALLVLAARRAPLAARVLIFQCASDAFCGQQWRWPSWSNTGDVPGDRHHILTKSYTSRRL